MRTSQRLALGTAGILIGLTSCDASQPVGSTAVTPATPDSRARPGNPSVGKNMKLRIGSKTFADTLDRNPAADKLKVMLPLTLDMSELNGNEPRSLPLTHARLVPPDWHSVSTSSNPTDGPEGRVVG